jgi:glycosyltransferase involved in cell wall biosynthesis
MKVSVIIPCHNDLDYLKNVVLTLILTQWGVNEVEILIVNDGSINPDGSLLLLKGYECWNPVLKMIDNPKNYGVGYSFDRGVQEATGDIIILTACDVFPRGRSWFSDVVRACTEHPNEIGCAATIKLSPDNLEMNDASERLYGADLIYKYNGFKEEWKSDILRTDGNYTSILEAKWRTTKDSNEPYEIPCLLGAFYFTTKEFYQKIRGFDTEKGNEWCGHKKYACLEPMLSLKARVYGGTTLIYPNIEVGHVFNRPIEGARSKDYQFWNRLWCAETMFTEEARQSLYSHLKFEHNLSIAQKWIKIHKQTIERVRNRNIKEGNLISIPCLNL